jgi:hypothetical protein
MCQDALNESGDFRVPFHPHCFLLPRESDFNAAPNRMMIHFF